MHIVNYGEWLKKIMTTGEEFDEITKAIREVELEFSLAAMDWLT